MNRTLYQAGMYKTALKKVAGSLAAWASPSEITRADFLALRSAAGVYWASRSPLQVKLELLPHL